MEIYAGQKEILAASDNADDGSLWWPYRLEPGFGCRALYLYVVLIR